VREREKERERERKIEHARHKLQAHYNDLPLAVQPRSEKMYPPYPPLEPMCVFLFQGFLAAIQPCINQHIRED